MTEKVYIQKALVMAGIGSRRAGEQLVRESRVKINGVAAKMGDKIDVERDKVEVDGKEVKISDKKVYYLVNKPVGYTCTVKDRHAKKKVVDLVPKYPKVWPVGRLDRDSRGLIILTNDGELTNKMTHPKFEHEKEYEVELDKEVSRDLPDRLRTGIKLKEGIARADKVKKLGQRKLGIVLHQGWNRQIRRMAEKCGYRVVDLKRVRVGKWKLGDLEEGGYINF